MSRSKQAFTLEGFLPKLVVAPTFVITVIFIYDKS